MGSALRRDYDWPLRIEDVLRGEFSVNACIFPYARFPSWLYEHGGLVRTYSRHWPPPLKRLPQPLVCLKPFEPYFQCALGSHFTASVVFLEQPQALQMVTRG